MWNMIPSLQGCVEVLAPAMSQPSFNSCCGLLLGWVMCLGRHTVLRVGRSADPTAIPDNSQRHGLDSYYNFFERSAWKPSDLAYRVGVLLMTRLKLLGRITLLVDDTLAHKRGKSVWGLGWWRDAVASTKKRTATATGHNWVVLAVAYTPPFCSAPVLALPLLARLHLPGKGQPSCPQLAREMLQEVLGWFPGRSFTLVGDGAYACKELLLDLPPQVHFVGRLRGDAALYDPRIPEQPKGKRGVKPKKGPRLPCPKEAAAQADRKSSGVGDWLWLAVEVCLYGQSRTLQALAYEVLWPRVLGYRTIQVVVVRDPEGKMKDCYLFTTDLNAGLSWVILMFAWRWSIEVLFRSSKQILDVEAPHHFCQQSVEKLAPWVWSMQTVVIAWYLSGGRDLPEAQHLRSSMGDWDSEWSLRHMLQVLQHATLHATFQPHSADRPQLLQMVQTLENWALLAA